MATKTITLTTSGGLQTDATRTTNTQGDGLTPPAGVGMWEATTNRHLNGGLETNTTGWSQNNGPEVITRDTTFSKFGSASLKVVTAGSVVSEGTDYSSTAAGTAANGQTWTVSAWVFVPLGATMVLQMVERDATNGLLAGGGVTNFTGTGAWQRVTVTATLSNASTSRLGMKVDTKTSAQAITFWVDGAQIERFGYATPFVNTTSAAVTRAISAITAPISLLTAVQGWVAMRWSPSVSTGGQVQPFTYGVDGNFGSFVGMSAIDLSTKWRFTAFQNNTAKQSQDINGFVPGQFVTEILYWTSSQVAISVAGNNFSTAVITANAFTPDVFRIGADIRSGDGPINGNIAWMAAGTGTLVNADSSTLNALGSTAPTVTQLQALNGGAAAPSFLWPAIDSTATQIFTLGGMLLMGAG